LIYRQLRLAKSISSMCSWESVKSFDFYRCNSLIGLVKGLEPILLASVLYFCVIWAFKRGDIPHMAMNLLSARKVETIPSQKEPLLAQGRGRSVSVRHAQRKQVVRYRYRLGGKPAI